MLFVSLLSGALVSGAFAASPLLDMAPLGVGLYVHHAPVRGVLYSATQVGGIAAWAAATYPAYVAATNEDDAAGSAWQAVLASAATLTIGSYVISVLDGGHLSDLEAKARSQGLGSAVDFRPGLPNVALVLPRSVALSRPASGVSPVVPSAAGVIYAD